MKKKGQRLVTVPIIKNPEEWPEEPFLIKGSVVTGMRPMTRAERAEHIRTSLLPFVIDIEDDVKGKIYCFISEVHETHGIKHKKKGR